MIVSSYPLCSEQMECVAVLCYVSTTLHIIICIRHVKGS